MTPDEKLNRICDMIAHQYQLVNQMARLMAEHSEATAKVALALREYIDAEQEPWKK